MSEDEGFRRFLQSGMAWFSVTQQKAEEILRDLADSGETAVGQAQKAFERIVERTRQGSEELRDLVRSEIREQVAALGLATKEDISRLEAKIEAAQAPPAPETPPATAPEERTPTPSTAPAATEAPAHTAPTSPTAPKTPPPAAPKTPPPTAQTAPTAPTGPTAPKTPPPTAPETPPPTAPSAAAAGEAPPASPGSSSSEKA